MQLLIHHGKSLSRFEGTAATATLYEYDGKKETSKTDNGIYKIINFVTDRTDKAV